MSDWAELSALDARHMWHPFTQAQTARPPVAIASAEGAVLRGVDGREYLDLISSWWVVLHGHGEPAIAQAIARQAGELDHVIFAGFTHEPAVRLAASLAEMMPGDLDRVFFSDDGSTAVEVALKMSYQYWRNKGEPERKRFLSLDGGYHGDTFGAMSVGTGSGFFDEWKDLLFESHTLPFPATWDGDNQAERKEAEALAALDGYLAEQGGETAALIMEPLIQGASGFRMCRPEFVRALAERLRAAGVLLIFDEVMTGFGRTGEMFACQKSGVTPDLVCLSKGLTGGFLPLAATVCREGIYRAFLGDSFDQAFSHGHSFTANPLGCAAANASLALLRQEGTQAKMAAIEARHRKGVEELRARAFIARPRIMGSIAAFEVEAAETAYGSAIGEKLQAMFLDDGLLIRPLGNVVYLLPPLCISEAQLDRAYQGIARTLEKLD